MKAHFRLIVIAVITLLVLGAPARAVEAQQEPGYAYAVLIEGAAARARWHGEYIEQVMPPSTTDLGSHNSLALRPFDDVPFISYYDATSQDLRLASPSPDGGNNCGWMGSWWCGIVDSEGDVGMYSSIDLWGTEEHWKIGISYFNGTGTGSLKYAEWDSLTPNEWKFSTVLTGNLYYAFGLHTSLKFSATGSPHIAYYAQNPYGNDAVNYAAYVGSEGNCGVGAAQGKWVCLEVDSGDEVGLYPSLDLRYDGTVYVAYYAGGSGDLKFATYSGFGPCGNGWTCMTLDGTNGFDVGAFPSLIAPRSPFEVMRIAYLDRSGGRLKYGYTVSSGGNCGATWQCDVIEEVGGSVMLMEIAMDMDEDGFPVIAYSAEGSIPGLEQLKVTRPTHRLYPPSYGNCGPYLYGYYNWYCTTLDSGGTNLDEGGYLSLAINSRGFATLAYYEKNLLVGNGSLKVFYERLDLFLPMIVK